MVKKVNFWSFLVGSADFGAKFLSSLHYYRYSEPQACHRRCNFWFLNQSLAYETQKRWPTDQKRWKNDFFWSFFGELGHLLTIYVILFLHYTTIDIWSEFWTPCMPPNTSFFYFWPISSMWDQEKWFKVQKWWKVTFSGHLFWGRLTLDPIFPGLTC